jgi:flagellar assembly protein FliH
MVAISKFLFDTDFAAGDEAARLAPRPDTRRFSANDLEAAKAAAYAEGVAAGRVAAEQDIARRIADACAVIGSKLDLLMKATAERGETQMREAVTAAVEIARRLLPSLGKREAIGEVEALIRECLTRLHDEPRLVVRVADELLDPVRQRIDQITGAAGYMGKIILFADPALKPGDARVEWADGGAERDGAAIWRDIDSAIQRFVEGGAGAPAASKQE